MKPKPTTDLSNGVVAVTPELPRDNAHFFAGRADEPVRVEIATVHVLKSIAA
jgi:hypothetical protein